MSVAEDNTRGVFHPTKVIVLSELPTREKEKYYQLLSYSNCKFRKDSEGRYVANVRLLAPHVKKTEGGGKRKDLTNYSLVFQERLRKLKEEGFINVRIVGVEPFDYNSYPRFTALIAFSGDTIRPKAKPLSWVMKIVEDIYDHRFSHEKVDVEREEDNPSYDLMLLIFPVFVVRRLGTNVGLKALVDQTCWDLAYNTHIYRRDYLELEIFGRFLQEFHDHDDLLFFLYVRSVIAKVLHINFKTRWTKSDGPGRQPKSLWMSHRECAHVAKIVFGTDNEELYRNFMALITPQMVGQLTATTDSRRMDITEYLHLSVVGYHQSQLRAQNASPTAHSGANGERLLVPLPGQLVPTAPVPVPDTESQYVTQQQTADATTAAATAAADLHVSGGRSYSQQQEHQQHEEGAYELEEEDGAGYAFRGSSNINKNNHHRYGSQQYDNSGGNNINSNHVDESGKPYYELNEEEYNNNNLSGNDNQYHQYEMQQQQQQQQQYDQTEEEGKSFAYNGYADDHNQANNDHDPYDDHDAHSAYTLDKLAAAPVPTLADYHAEQGRLYGGGVSNGSGGNNNEEEDYYQQEQEYGNNVDAGDGDPHGHGHDDDQDQAQQQQQDYKQGYDVVEGEGEGQLQQDGDGGNEDDAPNDFELLQLQREREFLDYLCEPLLMGDGAVPAEYAQMIEADLSERLRQTVNIYLSDKQITDLDSLDDFLVDFLGLEQLRVDMEATRDELVEHLLNLGQGQGGVGVDSTMEEAGPGGYAQYGGDGDGHGMGEDERKTHAANNY